MDEEDRAKLSELAAKLSTARTNVFRTSFVSERAMSEKNFVDHQLALAEMKILKQRIKWMISRIAYEARDQNES